MLTSLANNMTALLIVLFFVVPHSADTYIGNDKRKALFQQIKQNFRLEGSVIAKATFDLLSMCTQFCLREYNCRSFNYNPMSKMCEALFQNHLDVDSSKNTTEIGWHHYKREETDVSV